MARVGVSSGQGDGPTNRHKEMAMGKKIAVMKKGGSVKANKAVDKPMKPMAKTPMKKTVKKGK